MSGFDMLITPPRNVYLLTQQPQIASLLAPAVGLRQPPLTERS